MNLPERITMNKSIWEMNEKELNDIINNEEIKFLYWPSGKNSSEYLGALQFPGQVITVFAIQSANFITQSIFNEWEILEKEEELLKVKRKLMEYERDRD